MAAKLPDELTPAQQLEVQSLLRAEDDDFTRDVIKYLAVGDDAGRRVFHHYDLVDRTVATVGRILRASQAQERNRTLSPKRRQDASRMVVLAADEIGILKQVQREARAARADSGPGRHAERILGKEFPAEKNFLVHHLMKRGSSDESARQALREAMDPDLRLSRRGRANDLLGKLLVDVRNEMMRLLEAGEGRETVLAKAEEMLRRRYGG